MMKHIARFLVLTFCVYLVASLFVTMIHVLTS